MSRPRLPQASDDQTAPKPAGRGSSARDERLKAALKANIARRKAQVRARSAAGADLTAGEDTQDD